MTPGPYLAYPPCHNPVMKIKPNEWLGLAKDKVVASFGAARLVQTDAGNYELRGGSAEDQTLAKEWISLFMHEAVPRMVAEA
jgi:hypothetical protein